MKPNIPYPMKRRVAFAIDWRRSGQEWTDGPGGVFDTDRDDNEAARQVAEVYGASGQVPDGVTVRVRVWRDHSAPIDYLARCEIPDGEWQVAA